MLFYFYNIILLKLKTLLTFLAFHIIYVGMCRKKMAKKRRGYKRKERNRIGRKQQGICIR